MVGGDKEKLEAVCSDLWALPARRKLDRTWFEFNQSQAYMNGELLTIHRLFAPRSYWCCLRKFTYSENDVRNKASDLKIIIDKILQEEEQHAQAKK